MTKPLKRPSLADRRVRRPPCRSDITGRWAKLRSDLLDHLGHDRLTAELVDQMVLNLLHADHARTLAAEEPIIRGDRGQQSEHPGFRIAGRCESSARDTARILGLFEKGGSDAETQKAEPSASVRDELAALRNRKSG